MKSHKGSVGVSPLRSVPTGTNLPPITTTGRSGSMKAANQLVAMSPIRSSNDTSSGTTATTTNSTTTADSSAISSEAKHLFSEEETVVVASGSADSSAYVSLHKAAVTNPLTVFSTETDVDNDAQKKEEEGCLKVEASVSVINDVVNQSVSPKPATSSTSTSASDEISYKAFERLDHNLSDDDDHIVDVMVPSSSPSPQRDMKDKDVSSPAAAAAAASQQALQNKSSPSVIEWDDLGQPFSPTQTFKSQEKGASEEAELFLLDEKHLSHNKPGTKKAKKGKGTHRELSGDVDGEEIISLMERAASSSQQGGGGGVQWDDIGTPFSPTQVHYYDYHVSSQTYINDTLLK